MDLDETKKARNIRAMILAFFLRSATGDPFRGMARKRAGQRSRLPYRGWFLSSSLIWGTLGANSNS
jgi:hypothetical protein